MNLQKLHSRLAIVEKILTVLIFVSILLNSLLMFTVIMFIALLLFGIQLAIVRLINDNN